MAILSHQSKLALIGLSIARGAYGVDPLNDVSLPPPEDFVSCLFQKSLIFDLPGSCSYDLFKNALQDKMNMHLSCKRNDADWEIMAVFGVGSALDAKTKFDELCHQAITNQMQRRSVFDFNDVTDMDHDFNKAFFDGGSSWIDGSMTARQAEQLQTILPIVPIVPEEASTNFHGNSKRIRSIHQNVARKRPISWPDNIQNFNTCQANSAMCCWVDHDETRDLRYQRNTDLCYVDYSRAPSSSHVEAGLGLFGGLQDAFCHGFAWGEGSIDDQFKGNLLFLSEIHENMYIQGLSKNVAGKTCNVASVSL
jgi:hypothetical protein